MATSRAHTKGAHQRNSDSIIHVHNNESIIDANTCGAFDERVLLRFHLYECRKSRFGMGTPLFFCFLFFSFFFGGKKNRYKKIQKKNPNRKWCWEALTRPTGRRRLWRFGARPPPRAVSSPPLPRGRGGGHRRDEDDDERPNRRRNPKRRRTTMP